MFPFLQFTISYKTDLKLRSYCKKNFASLVFVKIKVRNIDGMRELNAYVVHTNGESTRNPANGLIRGWSSVYDTSRAY